MVIMQIGTQILHEMNLLILFSKSFKNFIQIVASFTSEEKRLFLKFVTGAERLPYGGNVF